MIVGEMFEEDDMDVAWRQHDVYHAALGVIVNGTNVFVRTARHVLKDQQHPSWGHVELIDHRTLQAAHDILAAAWRWRFLRVEHGLLREKQDDTVALESTWLAWLRGEVLAWINEPEIIRLLQIVMSNQNEPVGYAAEAKLGVVLIDRFTEVRWRSEFRLAISADFAKYPSSLLDDPRDQSVKDLDLHNTYRFPLFSQVEESP